MLNYLYASFREQLDSLDYAITVSPTGGSFTTAGTINLYLQLINRAGKNLLSPRTVINYSVDGKIAIEIKASAIKSGDEVFAIAIAGETTNNEQDAKILAIWKAREDDQITPRELPVTIELTSDAHLGLGIAIDNSSSFPNGSSLINGMMRQLGSNIYRYDSEATSGDYPATIGYWLKDLVGWNTYIASTQNNGGCDRSIELVEHVLLPPLKQDGIDTLPLRLWILNGFTEDGGATLLAGTRFSLRVEVNGYSVSPNGKDYSVLFANLIQLRPVGFVRRLTGELNTNVAGVGFTFNWNPANSLLELKQNLNRGYALAVDVTLSFTLDQLGGWIDEGDNIAIRFKRVGEVGVPSDLWNLTGDVALAEGERLRIVPDRALPGKGLVKGYRIDTYYDRPIVGLQPDKDNQLIAISGSVNGAIRVLQSTNALYPTESIRAIVSTVSGYSNPSAPSNEITLTATQGLTISVNLPIVGTKAVIRSDYPDLIAGNNKANWNGPQIRLYVAKDNQLYQKNDLISSGSSSTLTINVTSLSGFTSVPYIPQQADPAFGLFGYGEVITAVGSGTLQAGNYKCWIVWEYPAPNYKITKISHAPELGCLKEFQQTLDAFVAQVKYWSDPLPNVAAAKALSYQQLVANRVWLINGIPYIFDPSNISAGDDVGVVKPSAVGTNPGALVPLPTLGLKVSNPTITFKPHPKIRFTGGAVVSEDAAGDAIVVNVPTQSEGQIAYSSFVASDGSILVASDGSPLH